MRVCASALLLLSGCPEPPRIQVTATEDSGDETSETVDPSTGIDAFATESDMGTDPTTDSNGLPIALDDVFLTRQAEALSIAPPGVLTNDVGRDGELLSVAPFQIDSDNGARLVARADGGLTYTPVPRWWGEEGFTYTVANDAGAEATANVRIVTSPTSISLLDIAFDGFLILGDVGGDQSGRAVRGVGDVNGDGLEDVIVGAYQANTAAQNDAGRSYVVFGKADGASVDLGEVTDEVGGGFVIEGDGVGTRSGRSVSGAGDMNGDGLADLLIGADYGLVGAVNAGRSYVVFGKATTTRVLLSDIANPAGGVGGFVIDGETSEDGLGNSVSPAGDVNGDGRADVILGAPRHEPVVAFMNGGTAYVVFGKDDGAAVTLGSGGVRDGIGGFVIDSERDFSGCGTSVSTAGDIDGDGLSDVIVGCPGDDGSFGRAYVVFGKTDTRAVALALIGDLGTGGFLIEGEDAGDRFGTSVSGGGDVNGDGLADLLIGAHRAEAVTASTWSGRGYVVFGKADGTPVSPATWIPGVDGFAITATDLGGELGRQVSMAGDVDGDGLTDLILGARLADPNGADSGRSFVVFGGRDLTSVSLIGVANGIGGFAIDGEPPIMGETEGDRSGIAVSGAGDVDGDGLADLIIGAYDSEETLARQNAGASYVVFGGDYTRAITFRGSPSNDTFTGTAADESIVGGLGDDVLDSRGGRDVVYGGPGRDTIGLLDTAFFRIDGGVGEDTLRLQGAGLELDLTTLSPLAVRSIETIDLTGLGDNTLVVNPRSLFGLTEGRIVTVLGNGGDRVHLCGEDLVLTMLPDVSEYQLGHRTLRIDRDVVAECPE